WIDGRRLAAALAKHDLPGVRFMPLKMTPNSSTHSGQACDGVQILLDDWSRSKPLRTGRTIAIEMSRLTAEEWTIDRYDVLIGHKTTLEALKRGESWPELEKEWQPELDRFRERRRAHLLYPD